MIKFTTQLFCLAALSLGIASAATTYDVTLPDNVTVGKTQLKAGEYKVEIQGAKAVFTIGKKTVQVPATLEKNEQAFGSTVFVSKRSKLTEIDLGGTQDKIVFGVMASK
ncbi:MAG TPA: hypothetical protein VG273_25780 [Bryobacteraceae bacterium]|jgi:hypothetical protein|nr:hypothetical protein [Bryobacteraceae bacterium]